MQPLKSRQSSLSVHSLSVNYADGAEGDGSLRGFAFRAFLGTFLHPGRLGSGVDRPSPVCESLRCVRCFRILVLRVGVLRDADGRADPNQCLTLSKGIATVLVCIGIVIFNKGKSQS